jgi:hypothetical protein
MRVVTSCRPSSGTACRGSGSVEVDDHVRIAAALGRLCDELGLARSAAICDAEETVEILRAYDRDPGDGFAAFQRALDRSGLDPPDVPELRWGGVMSLDEAAARANAADRLEQAVDSGELRPGRSGWRAAQRRIVSAALAESVPGSPTGETRLHAVTTARLGDWLDRAHEAPVRARLVRELEPRLLLPAAVPAAAADVLAPLRWLLARAAADGLPLTERGNLARPVVQKAVAVFGWEDETFGKQVRSEVDLLTLPRWHDLLREQRWVRRRGRALRITEAGRALLDEDEVAWRGLCAGLVSPPDEFEAAVRESVLLLHLGSGDERLPHQAVNEGVAELVTELGWRVQGGGPLSPDDVSYRSGPFVGMLERFRLVEARWKRDAPPGSRLTEVGRAAALEMLRHRAMLPRR